MKRILIFPYVSAMFIKTIDGLKPIEQLVLKVGSVLGNNFRRTALAFVMSKDSSFNERSLAKGKTFIFFFIVVIPGKRKQR